MSTTPTQHPTIPADTTQTDPALAGYSDLELMRNIASRIPGLHILRLYLESVDPDTLTMEKKRRIVAMIDRAIWPTG